MATSDTIPFFDDPASASDDVGSQNPTSSPSSPTSSLLADVNFLYLFIGKTKLIRPISDDGDEVCCELSPMDGGSPVICRVTDPRVLGHANAIARQYSKGDPSCFLGQRDLQRLQDFCRAQITSDTPRRAVHKRLAWDAANQAIWLDLSRDDNLCVQITRTHWNLELPAQPMFLRGRTQRPLPEPVSSEDGYAALCRMLPPMPDTDIKLLIGAMLGMMIPSNFNDSFSLPILVITGDPGAGKSTLAKLLKTLLDNEIATVSTRPSKIEDLWVQALCSHILSYDNMRNVWDGLSDAMCALTTNAAQIRRSLYTNSSLNILRGHCAIILNGICPALAQQDLLDRSITITLSRFTAFDPDSSRTNEDLGLVLGYLCDLMVRALANYATTRLTGSVRLSLVAKIATAAEPFGCDTPFLDLLIGNQHNALVATREHDPVVDAIYDLMGTMPEWRGTYKELLATLALKTDLSTTSSTDWPRTANKLSAFIREHTRLIRELSINVTPGPKHNNGRIVTISRLPAFAYCKPR
jgi:energy-coupling factor transporter ATP-binding protein EcfA2